MFSPPLSNLFLQGSCSELQHNKQREKNMFPALLSSGNTVSHINPNSGCCEPTDRLLGELIHLCWTSTNDEKPRGTTGRYSGKGSHPAHCSQTSPKQGKRGILKTRWDPCFAVLRLNPHWSWTSISGAWNQTIPTMPGTFRICSSRAILAVCCSNSAW